MKCKSPWSVYSRNHGLAWWLIIGSWLWIFLLYFYLFYGTTWLIVKVIKLIIQKKADATENAPIEKKRHKDPNDNTLVIIIAAALLVLSVVVISACVKGNSDNNRTLPPSIDESKPDVAKSEPHDTAPEGTSDLEDISELRFSPSVSSEIKLNPDDIESVIVNVKEIDVEDLNINDIDFISTNESVAIIEFKETDSGFFSNDIICTIKAISEGEAMVKVSSKDGAVSTDEIKIIVTVPESDSEPPIETPVETTTGSASAPETPKETIYETYPSSLKYEFVGNKNSKIFHYSSCYSVKRMSSSNKDSQYTTREDMISQGYVPCEKCKP